MASAIAQLWIVERVVSSGPGYLRFAQFNAAPRKPHAKLRARGATHAASSWANERAFAPRSERPDRRDWGEDCRCDTGWRAGRKETGGVAGCSVQSEHGAGVGSGVERGLASGALVCVKASLGELPAPAATDDDL